ncbi:energy-coupling factor transporter transmembrane protein EcfT [Halalkalibacter sp. AB-rgal2]|uniref:energy-coupling factor transporter transmembrane component T family protein n=1 Tax=Halalkalibacter sp. AB-rgal2 TaxID=3242695 RepID=UPI00359D33C0
MMFQHILIGQYFPGQSIVHRLDARAKLLAVMVLVVVIFLARNWLSLGIICFCLFVLILLSRVTISYIWRAMKPILLLVIILFLIQLYTYRDGAVIVGDGIFAITEEGLTQGAMIAIRLLSLILVTSLLTLTTKPIVLTDGLEYLLRPFERVRLPSHELALMITIAIRFVPTLLQETERLLKAQFARGVSYRYGPWKKRMTALVSLLVPLFVHSFKRAEDLATAMESRAYRGGEGRTKYRALQWCVRDTVALVVVMIISGVIVYLRYV